ncbi:hypothetical protein BC332_13673 [Capsicum chinense]|nr:hypothetical protein BC332_13673 [Capsicum chinense]
MSHTLNKSKGKSSDGDDLVSLVGLRFKNKNLIEALKAKRLSKKHKQSLCLVWFVHNILYGRDVNNNVPFGLIKLSEDLEAFNNYPWGYESFKMTVKYLLTPLTPKKINLYGFPWAFMGGPVVADGVKGNGVVDGGSGAAVGDNDAPLTVFETTNHYDYDHIGFTYFLHPMNVLHANVKTARQNMMDIDNSGFPGGCHIEAIAEHYNIIVDNLSTASKDEEKGLRYFCCAYAEYLSEELQVPYDGLDFRLLCKRYATLLWKYGEASLETVRK